ncbi:mucin-5B-like [Heptranchias perlo]|uniref:mucin-5B-like n=1 Tax=Heptranchias perlo TaxID=212740 RepID=UPI00355A6158
MLETGEKKPGVNLLSRMILEWWVILAEEKQCSKDEVYTNCKNNEVGKRCELSCESLSYKHNLCSSACEEGCMCKPGLVRSPEGQCINKTECPCKHGGQLYFPRETFLHDCNLCTCQFGILNCTEEDCSKICVAYGASQYVLYDKLWLEYESNNCRILLTESRPNSTPVPFRVEVKNVACSDFGGVICRKDVYIMVGAVTLTLDNTDGIISYSEEPDYPFRISRLGFFIIVETAIGLTVYWDLHMQVLVQIKPELKKSVQGFCGEADESLSTHLSNINMLGSEYGNQWVTSMCSSQLINIPLAHDLEYAEARCSQLLRVTFSSCHREINVDQYYKSCKSITSKCYSEEEGQCFCGALAAYSRACCRQGVSINWRKPDNCPSHCEYYNRARGNGPLLLNNKNGLFVSISTTKGLLLEKFNESRVLSMSFSVTPALYKTASGRLKTYELKLGRTIFQASMVAA